MEFLMFEQRKGSRTVSAVIISIIIIIVVVARRPPSKWQWKLFEVFAVKISQIFDLTNDWLNILFIFC